MGRGGVSETLGGMSREDAVISGLRHAHAPQRLQALRVCRNQVRARGSPSPDGTEGGDGDGEGCWRAGELESPHRLLQPAGGTVRRQGPLFSHPLGPTVTRFVVGDAGDGALAPRRCGEDHLVPALARGRCPRQLRPTAHWLSSLLDRPHARRTGPPLDRRSTPGPCLPPAG